ncbi:MAG: hypothetical protein GY737_18580 [Desulfobacteraceae bacterium]|nr:hypothetical protein [Desulfobacteraceae bacterium]
MLELVLCKEPMQTDSLAKDLGINGNEITGVADSNPTMLKPYTPYRVGQKSPHIGESLLSQLSPITISRNLTDLALSLGEENVTALADMFAILQKHGPGLMGASSSLYINQVDSFIKSVERYQAALMEYRKVLKTNPVASALAERNARAAFKNMQGRFRHTLASITAQSKSRKGIPLTDIKRGLNIARSSRRATKLNITSQVQANNLVMLSQNLKLFGNGLAVIDFGSRVGNIHNSYRAGENWERELFIESLSFAASAYAGSNVMLTGTAALGILVAATPLSPLVIILCGIAIAGTAARASMLVNNELKNNGGALYDWIMSGVGTL